MAHDPQFWSKTLGGFRDGVATYQGTFKFGIKLIERDPKEEAEAFLEDLKAAGADLGGWEPSALRENPPYPRDHPLVCVAKEMKAEWPWLGTFVWSDGDEHRVLDVVAAAVNQNSIKAFDEFRARARIAGAHLPLEFRGEMPVDRDDPLERWLSLMIYSRPTTLRNIRESGNPMHVGSMHPFQDAADVIERCRLDTDRPAFLPEELLGEAPMNQERPSGSTPAARGRELRKLEKRPEYERILPESSTPIHSGTSRPHSPSTTSPLCS